MTKSDPSNTSGNSNFWSTLPGVLTGLTALLGAVGALLTVFHQIGWINQPNTSSGASPAARPQDSPSTSSNPDTATSPMSNSLAIAPSKGAVDPGVIEQSNVSTSLSVTQEPSNPGGISQSRSVAIPSSAAPAKGNEGQTVTAANVARPINSRTWEWQIFIQGSEETLNRVECVEYHLHPTFADPKRTVCQKGNSTRAFPLTATAWGTFPIDIRVIFKDGQVQELTHDLRF